jgi:hypothetical protein
MRKFSVNRQFDVNPQKSEVNEYGDIRCPVCGLWIITPAGMEYRAGVGLCRLCMCVFILSQEVARMANDRLDKCPQDATRRLVICAMAKA